MALTTNCEVDWFVWDGRLTCLHQSGYFGRFRCIDIVFRCSFSGYASRGLERGRMAVVEFYAMSDTVEETSRWFTSNCVRVSINW
jgi:hypothetical protein